MTPFESYMFVDDSVRYPMTFVVQFNASGNLDRQKFQTAIDEALKRHPMLRTRVQIAKASRYCWVDTPTYDSTINWGDLDQPIQVDGAGEFIDLKEEIQPL